MAFKVSWYIQGRVIYDEVWGAVTIDDVSGTSDALRVLLDEATGGEQRCHVIVDITRLSRLPLTLGQTNKAISHFKHPNLGWSLLVNRNKFALFLASVIAQMFRARFRAFATIEEALQFLIEQDASLEAPIKQQGLPVSSAVPEADAEQVEKDS